MRFVERDKFTIAGNGTRVSLNAVVSPVHVHGLNFAATSPGREQGCGAAAPGERDYERGSRGWEARGGRQDVGCGAAAPVRR
jgi:hypothetical protein